MVFRLLRCTPPALTLTLSRGETANRSVDLSAQARGFSVIALYSIVASISGRSKLTCNTLN
jgi:hypothetical protein